MSRLAWFTPLPPVRSGIAAYNAELLPLLAGDHAIDVFTSAPGANPARAGFHEDHETNPAKAGFHGSAQSGPAKAGPHAEVWSPALAGLERTHAEMWSPALAGLERTHAEMWSPALAGLSVFSAHDFLWKHDRRPYDLVVYQLGNAACHDFMWPHLPRFPGLVVLHDGQLHHERSRALLSRGRVEDYRAEFRYNHPDAPAHLPDLVESTLGGSVYYLYPMLRWVVRTARLVAVHSEGLAADIREAHPGVEVRTVPHGMVDPVTDAARDAAAEVRRRQRVPEGATLFAAFGMVTPEKRISAALRALAAVAAQGVDAYLLLAGDTTSYYDVAAEARALSIAERVRITGYVPDEDLPAYVLAADACLCLRWPTSRETSGTWIRAIAAGRPTVITDLAHTTDVPSLDPRTWLPIGEPEAVVARGSSPVSIAIGLLDEDDSLRLAMTRLASDRGLREELGRNARAWWEGHHTMPLAVEGYRAAIERAMARPIPRVRDLPPHLLSDDTELARRIASEMGITLDVFDRRV